MINAFIELHSLHRIMEAGSGLLEKSIGVPACISNCGRCCQENTALCMAIEAVNMASYLPSVGKNLGNAIDLAEGWLLEPVKDVTIYNGIPRGLMSQQLLHETHVVNKRQCPFLSNTNECSIYEARPLTCRTFGVYRDAMPICPRPQGKGETLTQKAIIDAGPVKPLVNEFRMNCKAKNPGWVLSGFAPTMLFRATYPEKLKEYVADNKIASAKLVGVDINLELLWQSQVDDIRRGVSPAEVLKKELLVSSR